MGRTGNTNALKHGAASAEKSLQRGEPLAGLALSAQEQTHADYEQHGADYLIREHAERLHAVTRLYWDAILAAAQVGDLEALDRYVARFGWLSGKSLLAWAEVKRSDGKKNIKTLDAVLRKGSNE